MQKQNQKVKRQKAQNQSRAVLQNKIRNDLIILGKSAIKELIPRYSKNFDFVVVPDKTNSPKIIEVIQTCKKFGVTVNQDSSLIREIENFDFDIDSSGVIAFLNRKIGEFYSLKEVFELIDNLETCTVVAFPDIDYEQNLGAMIRTCVGMNVDFILIPNGQQKIFSSTVTKVSMGYNHIIPIVQENFLLAIEQLKEKDFDIFGLDMEGENIEEVEYNSRACFVVGNEGKGLTDTILRKCNKKVSIPMNNVVESLNVSVSLGIALYDRNKKIHEIKGKI
jgi:tRNA G18 (ribose-2'-O)-methylase SpoU